MTSVPIGTKPEAVVYFDTGNGTVQVVNADNPLPVDATISGNISSVTTAHATAAAPSYTEGTDNSLSSDLSGNLRVIFTGGNLTSAGNVTVTNAAGASAVNIQDGGNSLTVDGTVSATQSGTWTVQPGNTANTTAWKVDGSAVTQPVSGAISFTAPQHVIMDSGTITTISTVTAGNITVNNAAGASAVNIQDGGNSITVDGAVSFTAPQHIIVDSGTITTVTSVTGAIINNAAGASAVNVQDGGNSLTVDGSVVLTASSAVIGHVIVDSGSINVGTVTTLPVGHNVIDSGTLTAVTSITNPVAVTGTFWQTTQPVSDANLELTQGVSGASTVGPMVQAVVNDAPQSYIDGYIQPLSLTGDGRLRVSSVQSNIDSVWQNTFKNFRVTDEVNFTSEVAYV